MIIQATDCPCCGCLMYMHLKYKIIPYHICMNCGYEISNKKLVNKKIKRIKEILEME